MIEIKTKVCKACKVEKYETDFNKNPDGPGGLRGQCKACESEYKKNHYEKRKAMYAGVNVYDGGDKTCLKCLNVFPKEKGYWAENPSNPGGLNCYCRVCRNRRSQGYKDSGDLADDIVGRVVRKWSAERVTKRSKKETSSPWIGHSEGDFFNMLIEQRGRCAVSGLPLTPENVSIDHILPVIKGGTHELANLRLVVWGVNRAMSDMEDAEFIQLCIQIADYQWSQIW
jgi:hypothetical protein